MEDASSTLSSSSGSPGSPSSTLSSTSGSPGSPSNFQSPQFVKKTLDDLEVMLTFLATSTDVEDLEATLLSTEFRNILMNVSELPIHLRRVSSCRVMNYLLLLLKYEDLKKTVFKILEIFSRVMVVKNSFLPSCLEVISKFIFNLESEDAYLCRSIILVLFSKNYKFWRECEMVLLQHQMSSDLASDSCRLVAIIYSVDSSLTVNIINNISNMMKSQNPDVKKYGIELALKIFTSEHSGFSSGFLELWKNLCASLKNRYLDKQLMTGFITELLVKQPEFRQSYLDVLSFYLQNKKTKVTINIYKAVTQAVLSAGSIFINDSNCLTLITEGLASKKPKVQKCAVISLATIYRWTLFCNYSLTTEQEDNWKKDAIALLNIILRSIHIRGVKTLFRDSLKGILYKYLVPRCMTKATRVKLVLMMWMNLRPMARSTMEHISRTSYRVRSSFLELFYSKKNVLPYATRISAALGAKVEDVCTVLSFLRADKLFNTLMMRFFESVSAEESADTAENILVIAREKEGKWTKENHHVLHTLLQYLTNNLFDGVAVTILLELILKIDISQTENIKVALDLFETVILENPVISLREEVLEQLVQLKNVQNIDDVDVVKRIFRRMSTIPGHLLQVDKQKYNSYKVLMNRCRQ